MSNKTSTTVPAVRLERLTRTFDSRRTPVTALDGVDLTVDQGEFVAVLGENGAGKTTLTKILATLLLPTSGTATVLGHDVSEDDAFVRRSTTAVFGGDRGLYTMLSGRENLRYFGVLHGVSARQLRRDSDTVLDTVGLGDAADRRVETYSKGMRQRLHMAIGLLTSPPLLLLDEPTVGLDPSEADRLRDVVAGLRSEGSTVLLTSHNLLDVERLVDRVVMISRGRIVHDLPLREFRALAGYEAVVTVVLEGHRDARIAGGTVAHDAATTTLTVPITAWTPAALNTLSVALEGETVLDMSVRSATLEEAFSQATRSQL